MVPMKTKNKPRAKERATMVTVLGEAIFQAVSTQPERFPLEPNEKAGDGIPGEDAPRGGEGMGFRMEQGKKRKKRWRRVGPPLLCAASEPQPRVGRSSGPWLNRWVSVLSSHRRVVPGLPHPRGVGVVEGWLDVGGGVALGYLEGARW